MKATDDPDVFEGRVERFAATLRTALLAARAETARYSLVHAERFNVFDYIRPDENAISDILADLLDGEGKHGQGDAFLRLFLDKLNPSVPAGVPRVSREEPTARLVRNLRRLDILLDYGSFGLGIENKPWAGDQADQVSDYIEQLERRYHESFLIVYLSGSSSPPASLKPAEVRRRRKRGQLVTMDYRSDLADWLSRCVEACRSQRVTGFLHDFHEYVVERFG